MLESIKQLYNTSIAELESLISQKQQMIEQEVGAQAAVLEQNVIAPKCKEIDDGLASLANAMRASVEGQIAEKARIAEQGKVKFRDEQLTKLRAQITAKYYEEIRQLTAEKQEIKDKLSR